MANRKFATNIDLLNNQLLNALAQLLSSDPGSPVEGQFWYDTTNHVWKFRNNSATITLGRLDQISAPTGDVSLNSHKLTSVTDGTADTDAATVGQMNALVRGLDWKASVRVATTVAGTLASSFANGQTVDGVSLVTGDSILIKNQSSALENGIYIVAASGSPTRRTDADANAEVTGGQTVWVNEGTANGDTSWTLTTNDPITLGSTGLTYVKSGSAPLGAGTVTKYAASFGDGAASSFNIDHNLGSLDCSVTVFDNSSGEEVEFGVVHSTTNRVVLSTSSVPTSNQYRVVVLA